MLKVSDIMRSQVYRIDHRTSVRDTAIELIARSIESALVVDGDLLVGIITERDLLKAVLPTVDEVMQSHDKASLSELVELARERGDQVIGDIATRRVQTTTPDTAAARALGSMLASRVRRLPVIDGEQIVGVVTTRDLLTAVFLERKTLEGR